MISAICLREIKNKYWYYRNVITKYWPTV